MSETGKKNTLSLVERMKQKVQSQQPYGGETPVHAASINVRDCPNCGAARAQQDGLTHCAYCGFEFIRTSLTDGLYIQESDNTQKKDHV